MRLTLSKTMRHNLVSKYMLGNTLEKDASLISSCKSHRLMCRAQLISSSGKGAYNVLPMGLRALEKLIRIIDDEMANIGCLKMNLSCLSSVTPWKKSKRWDSFGNELVKLKMSNTEYCLNATHEEAVTSMVASTGSLAVGNLPLKLYQITTKFRNEPRPRFGLLRCREFHMKDLYTFDKDFESAVTTYEQVAESYKRIFNKLKLDFIRASSSCGNIGGEFSHEYLIPADIGEDKIYISEEGAAWNAEYNSEILYQKQKTQIQAIELGHTFLLGEFYSKIFGAHLTSTDAKCMPLQMGCYGLGVTRILAGCVEYFSDEDGVRWPYVIAPFKVCIITPKRGSKEYKCSENMGFALYNKLNEVDGLLGDVIIDDRDSKTIGKRLGDAKLIGYPVIVIIGKHILNEDPKVEVLLQNRNESSLIPSSVLVEYIKEIDKNLQ